MEKEKKSTAKESAVATKAKKTTKKTKEAEARESTETYDSAEASLVGEAFASSETETLNDKADVYKRQLQESVSHHLDTSMPSWKTNIAKLEELSLATNPIIRTVLKVLDLRAASRCK